MNRKKGNKEQTPVDSPSHAGQPAAQQADDMDDSSSSSDVSEEDSDEHEQMGATGAEDVSLLVSGASSDKQ